MAFRDKNLRALPTDGGVLQMPQNLEAERALIASIFVDNESLHTCLEHITADDFYKEAHRVIFQTLVELSDKNMLIDLVTLNSALETRGLLERAGGSSYLAQLFDTTPSATHVEQYAKLVRGKSLVRRLLHASEDIAQQCFQSDDVETLIDQAESQIFAVSALKVKKSFSAVRDIVKDSYRQIEEMFERKGEISGLTTGFQDLDRLLHGLQKGDLFIVAGRPSMGKTAFALNLAENAALKSGARVAIFSLEMGKEQLVLRMLTSQAKVSSADIKRGEVGENDWPRIIDACDRIAGMQIYIDDQAAQSTMEIRAKARRLKKEHGLDLVIVDYLQLMRSVTHTQSREQEISDISRSLKALAKELQVPVIALSQLNRSLESRQNKRPMMSDLRESGAIEQDADVIAFVYRDEVYNENTPDKNVAEIIVGKHRNGETGVARLFFHKQYTRFEDLALDSAYAYIPPQD